MTDGRTAQRRGDTIAAAVICFACLLGTIALTEYFFPLQWPAHVTFPFQRPGHIARMPVQDSPPAGLFAPDAAPPGDHGATTPADAEKAAAKTPPAGRSAAVPRHAGSPTASVAAAAPTQGAATSEVPVHEKKSTSGRSAVRAARGTRPSPLAPQVPRQKVNPVGPSHPSSSATPAGASAAPGAPPGPATASSSGHEGGARIGTGHRPGIGTEGAVQSETRVQADVQTTAKGFSSDRSEGAPRRQRKRGPAKAAVSRGSLSSLSVRKTLKQVWPTYIRSTRVNVPIPGHQWVAKHVDSLKKKRFEQIVPQRFDYSCGAAALATLLTYYFGRITSEKEAMKGMIRFGNPEMIRKRGFSLLDMQKYANEIGYRAGGYKVHLAQLEKIRLPLIVLITLGGRPHFVVLKGVRDGRAFLADPSVGNHVMDADRFGRVWNGTIFALQGPKNDGAPGLPLVAARPPGPDGQIAGMGLGFQFPLALDPARRIYINAQLAPPGILLPPSAR